MVTANVIDNVVVLLLYADSPIPINGAERLENWLEWSGAVSGL